MLILALMLAGQEIIHVDERKPMPVLLLAPLGELKIINSTRVISGLSSMLTPKTDLAVESAEPEHASDCAGELACLIEKTGARTSLLLVLSAVRTKNGDRISATLVDVDEARAEMSRGDRTDKEAIESAIGERAVLVRPLWQEIASEAELDAWIAKWIAEDLRSVLERRREWEPFGEILLEGVPKGSSIALDGAPAGMVKEDSVRIAGVKPGPRIILVEHPSIEATSISVAVSKGQVAHVTPSFKSGDPSLVRPALFWAGAGTAAAGAAIFVYAIAAGDHQDTVCLTRDVPASMCEGPAFVGSGVPLGYSLVAAGALWAIGARFFGEEEDTPWIALLAGAVAGAAAFTVSIAAAH